MIAYKTEIIDYGKAGKTKKYIFDDPKNKILGQFLTVDAEMFRKEIERALSEITKERRKPIVVETNMCKVVVGKKKTALIGTIKDVNYKEKTIISTEAFSEILSNI